MRRVRFAARDPGAANVLARFIAGWAPRANDVWDLWAMPKAAAVFRREGVQNLEVFDDPCDAGSLEREWTLRPADVLVTGTSHYAGFEPVLWEIAARAKCPSLAVIDQWTNLERRFQYGRPDQLGVIHEYQRRECLEMGWPEEALQVVGHPWLAGLAIERMQQPTSGERPLAEGEPVNVLFASEPIAQDVAAGHNEPYGFDEFDAFCALYRGAASAAAAGRPVLLTVKFHPYEDPAVFKTKVRGLQSASGVSLRFAEPESAIRPLIDAAHLVVGISSMALLEAMALGKPVISVQPGLIREDTFAASRLGAALSLTDAEEAVSVLAELIAGAEARQAVRAGHRAFLEQIPIDPVQPLSRWIAATARRRVPADRLGRTA